MTVSLEFLPADAIGLDPLVRDAWSGARPEPPLPALPRRLDQVPRPADRFDVDARAELVAEWEEHLAALRPPVAALDSLRRLAQPGASIVLATAEPGFLGGQLESLWTGLHAVRLARDLENLWTTPVVPVLWNLADTPCGPPVQAFCNENLDLRRVSLSTIDVDRLPADRVIAAGQPLDALCALVTSLVWEGGHTEDALELCLPRGGETQARAHTRVVAGLLGPLGLVPLEPAWLQDRVSRTLAALVGHDPRPVFGEAGADPGHESSTSADVGLSTGSERQRGERTDAPPDLVLHRCSATGRTRALAAGGDGYRYGGEIGSRTPAELAAQIVQDPAVWSAAPALTPLVQTGALPLAVRVGGGRELGRVVRGAALAGAAGLTEPPFVPRLSATVVDPECDRALERLGLALRDVLSGAVELSPAEPETPVADRIRDLAARTAAELRESRPAVAAVDRGLAAQLRRASDLARGPLDELARRIERVERNRAGKGRRHERRLQSSLRPDGRPQEKVLGVLDLLARHGGDAVRDVVDELEPFPTEHCLLRFATET